MHLTTDLRENPLRPHVLEKARSYCLNEEHGIYIARTDRKSWFVSFDAKAWGRKVKDNDAWVGVSWIPNRRGRGYALYGFIAGNKVQDKSAQKIKTAVRMAVSMLIQLDMRRRLCG